MKGAPGLIVAALLGALGVALNWLYLQNKAGQLETVEFLGTAKVISAGELLDESHLVPVRIPKVHVGQLERSVFLAADQASLLGDRPTRNYEAGELLLRMDFKKPTPDLTLGSKEFLMWVPVDATSFVSDLVDPGDKILFVVPTGRGPGVGPTPAIPGLPPSDSNANPTSPSRMGGSEPVGPFVVAAVGSRLGSLAVTKANQVVPGGSNVIGVVVKNEGTDDDPKLEGKAARLDALLAGTPNLKARVILYPKTKRP